ncbi:unnamed protein product [Phytophthora lilii]|uniref:Unnamed protein product n=1 Tax=Phytophthora lilii TaxID=2077276 RepID=A0A9W6WRM2_9STRA|nr:unnamed protein product [Phytophthora lilii]
MRYNGKSHSDEKRLASSQHFGPFCTAHRALEPAKLAPNDMEGDTPVMPTDFLQDLDLWLMQGGAISPAIGRQNLDTNAANASFEAALLTPTDPVTGPDKADADGGFVAALTDDSLPWAALARASPGANGATSSVAAIPPLPTSEEAVEVTKPKKTRKGRPPATSTKTSPLQPPTKKSKTNKSTSQRQKEELAYLREKSEQLEAELTALKQRNREELERQQKEQEQQELGAELSTAMVTRGMDEFAAPAQPEVSLWERIAKRQREEKAKAEVENVKLREMVQSQMRLVKSFERLLRKRKIWDQLQENTNNHGEDESRKEEEVLDEMLRDVDERYPQVDKVLREHGLGESDPAVDVKDDANMKYSPTDGMYLEYKEKKFMPFDHKTLDDVVWRSFGEGKLKLEDSQLTIIKSTQDLMFSRVTLPLKRKGLNSSDKDMGHSINVTAMKRFNEDRRVVYVWIANTSVKHARDGSTSPVLLIQKGYATMEAATLPDGSPGSVIRSYTSSVPTLSNQPPEGDAEQHREVGLLTEMVFAGYQQSRQSINQTLENLVLDEMMAKNASTPATLTADTDISV